MPQIAFLFEHWVRWLCDRGGLIKPLPDISVETLSGSNMDFTAQLVPGEPPRIELSQSFLDEVRQTSSKAVAEVLKACAAGFEYDEEDLEVRRRSAKPRSSCKSRSSFCMSYFMFSAVISASI